MNTKVSSILLRHRVWPILRHTTTNLPFLSSTDMHLHLPMDLVLGSTMTCRRLPVRRRWKVKGSLLILWFRFDSIAVCIHSYDQANGSKHRCETGKCRSVETFRGDELGNDHHQEWKVRRERKQVVSLNIYRRVISWQVLLCLTWSFSSLKWTSWSSCVRCSSLLTLLSQSLERCVCVHAQLVFSPSSGWHGHCWIHLLDEWRFLIIVWRQWWLNN